MDNVLGEFRHIYGNKNQMIMGLSQFFTAIEIQGTLLIGNKLLIWTIQYMGLKINAYSTFHFKGKTSLWYGPTLDTYDTVVDFLEIPTSEKKLK